MWQRYFFGLSMLIIYLMTTFRYLAPIVHYQLDYTYISEVLCINRDKPKMHCNGKCQLREQLKKVQNTSSDKHKEALQHLISNYHAIENVPQAALRLLPPIAPSTPAPKVVYCIASYTTVAESPFHPPQV